MRRRSLTGARLFRLVTAAVAILSVPGSTGAQEPLPPDFDRWIREGMEARGIPGLALAVVHGDSVVAERGYGVRSRTGDESVNGRTLFAIGSATKAFTAAVVGRRVGEGEVGWDDPVRAHVPWFRLPDSYRSDSATVRDLLAHRTGLGRTPFLVLNSETMTREEAVRRLRHGRIIRGFREGYAYQNVLYVAAGLLAAESAEATWDDLVRRSLLAPLEMDRTTTTVDSLDQLDNVAAPHVRGPGSVQAVPWRDIDHVGPAGSIVSSARDMARWLRLHLGHGVVEGTEVLDSATVAEMQAPQSLISQDAPISAYLFSAFESRGLTQTPTYGLGWYVLDYRGEKLVFHGGDIDGMAALVAMLPDRGLGVVILTNLQSQFFPYAVALRLFDHALGRQGPGWGEIFRKRLAAVTRAQERRQQRQESARVPGTRPRLELARYAGSYQSALHGDLEVSAGDAALVLKLGPAMVGDLEHWHFDTWRVRWRNQPLQEMSSLFVTFRLGPAGQVEELVLTSSGRTVGEFERERLTSDESP